jgi:ferredoxin-type protein NapH
LGKVWGGLRHIVQLGFTALTNGYAAGFLQGKIYTGDLKRFCVPGLSCYSCPGAFGACPVGALQSVLTSRTLNFSYYVVGFLVMVGALLGRFVCGWLCPFGLVQDLLYKIPFVKKMKRLPGDRWLKYLRYVILAVFVVLLPIFVLDISGLGKPWFCAYICPAGTLMAGIPLVSLNPELRAVLGWLFDWKVLLLIVFVVLSVVDYRPFCRYVCPLGAIYSPFNKIALYRFRIDADKCTNCKACQRACKFGIPVYDEPNSAECIRCGDCRRACPTGAILTTLQRKSEKAKR